MLGGLLPKHFSCILFLLIKGGKQLMKKIVAIISCILVFASFLTIQFVIYEPLTETQYQTLEQVVYDAYTNEDFLIEVPDGVHLTKSETTITADFSRLPTTIPYGHVEGTLVNNEFTVTRYDETVDTVILIIALSFIITVFFAFIVAIICLVFYAALIIASGDEDEISINFRGVKNIKQFFKRIKEWINFKKLLAIIIVIIIFIGNIAFYMHITRPFNEDEWKQAEIIAENVYSSNSDLIEIPEDFDISIDEYKIVVSDNEEWSKGTSTLIATIKNGNLVFTRNNGIVEQILLSLFCGFATPFILLIIIVLVCVLYEEVIEPPISKLKKKFKEKRSIKKAEKIKKKVKKNKIK